MKMHYCFDDRCVAACRLMHNHGVKHVSLEHNAACEPLVYAIFINFKKLSIRKVGDESGWSHESGPRS